MKIGQRFRPYRLFHGSFIPNALLRCTTISATAKLVWARLAQFMGEHGEAYPSLDTLASEVGASRRAVVNAIKELEEQKFIERVTPTGQDRLYHRTTRYFFLWHPIFEEEKPITDNDGSIRFGDDEEPQTQTTTQAEQPKGQNLHLREGNNCTSGSAKNALRKKEIQEEKDQGEQYPPLLSPPKKAECTTTSNQLELPDPEDYDSLYAYYEGETITITEPDATTNTTEHLTTTVTATTTTTTTTTATTTQMQHTTTTTTTTQNENDDNEDPFHDYITANDANQLLATIMSIEPKRIPTLVTDKTRTLMQKYHRDDFVNAYTAWVMRGYNDLSYAWLDWVEHPERYQNRRENKYQQTNNNTTIPNTNNNHNTPASHAPYKPPEPTTEYDRDATLISIRQILASKGIVSPIPTWQRPNYKPS